MAATDTLKPGIRTGNFAPCRAGGFEGNHLTHSSFIPAKSASSRRMTVTLATRSREVPAALRMADTFFKHCLVCSWIVSPTIFPVTGSCGPVPETNTRPAARTAWLYVGGGDGASVVRMMSLATNFSSPEAEYLPAAEITRFPRHFCNGNGNGNGNGNVSCHCTCRDCPCPDSVSHNQVAVVARNSPIASPRAEQQGELRSEFLRGAKG